LFARITFSYPYEVMGSIRVFALSQSTPEFSCRKIYSMLPMKRKAMFCPSGVTIGTFMIADRARETAWEPGPFDLCLSVFDFSDGFFDRAPLTSLP
jgi:hypothetical protein